MSIQNTPRSTDERDLAVLRLRAKGMISPEIAKLVGLTDSDVRKICSRIQRDYEASEVAQ